MTSSPRLRLLLSFAPYALVAVLHLAGLGAAAAGTDATALVVATKPLLMPTLLVGLLLVVRSPRAPVLLAGAAILFSWVGDAALMLPGELWFLVGLCGFLVGHIFYVLLISRHLSVRRIPLAALAYVGWWIALVALLAPHVGWLVWPLAAYGIVLGLMAASATRAAAVIGVGALLFLVSDTVLAIDRFMPSVAIGQPDLLVMSTYILAQGCIVAGAAWHLRTVTSESHHAAASVAHVMRADATR